MGVLDALFGRTKPVAANLDALFALPSAAITLQSSVGLISSGKAGVCWKPPAGQAVEEVRHDLNDLLEIADDENVGDGGVGDGGVGDGGVGDGGVGDRDRPPASSGPNARPVGKLVHSEDSYGYQWLVLDDPDVENLVTRVHMVNSTLTDNGWGPQLLCSVFAMTPGPDASDETNATFLVYLYKRGTFYPFSPIGPEKRDTEEELRIKAVLGADLPVESDLSRWFPLWDLPLK
ncbi:MAG: PspA-associated protein PspAB [Acidimicrobiales bacterium]